MRECEGGDKFSVCSSLAFSLRTLPQVSLRPSVESYRGVSLVCSTCSGHVHREFSKPSETLHHTNTASLLCFLKRKCRLWQLRFSVEK